ncbi:MAG: ABC transporter ATP-binding protein [Acetobacter orientalis]|uniref:ABC transporter ATP-binding protein n=1 Tax=Acetobacter orientalis TaxID=146474 RepID=UPI00386A001C
MVEPVPPCTIQGLVKQYGAKQALNAVSLTLQAGEIAALLGPNGAGKTTLIGCLLGFLSTDAGHIHLFGEDINSLTPQTRNRIGFVPQTMTGLTWFKVGELLTYLAGYRAANTPQDNRWLQWADLDPQARVKSLSGGERQRLAIVLALRFCPDLIVLDEPVASLDPQARYDFMQLLPDYARAHGATVLISSHIISDLEKICDQFIIMQKGHIKLTLSHTMLHEHIRLLSAAPPTDWGLTPLAPGLNGGIWVSGWHTALTENAAQAGITASMPDIENLFLALSK